MSESKYSPEMDTPLKHEALTGLTSAQVLEQRATFGENRLPSEKGVSVWTILFNQLKSPLVYIILAAPAAGNASARSRSIPTVCDPCPGNTKAVLLGSNSLIVVTRNSGSHSPDSEYPLWTRSPARHWMP